jgi:hypothetical protein
VAVGRGVPASREIHAAPTGEAVARRILCLGPPLPCQAGRGQYQTSV